MPAAVVFDAVSAFHDFANQPGMRRGLVADDEKAGFRMMRIQDIQNLRSNLRIRSIVERQGDFVALRRGLGQAQHVVAQQAAFRP